MTTKVGQDMIDAEAVEENLPPTTKGDLIAYDGSDNVRVGVGTNGQVLTADSAEATGIKWDTPSSGSSTPVGQVGMFANTTLPTGWLECDGAAVSRTTYATLFAAIASDYGDGDGATTFNVPDMRGRFSLGIGTGSRAFAISSIDTGTDQITVPSNTELQTGQAVVYTTTGSAATPLVSATTYYVIRVSATQVQLAGTRAAAIAGTVINLTATGSGTQTLTLSLTARSLADYGGEQGHSLLETEMPSHTHTEEVTLNSGTANLGSPAPLPAASQTTQATGSAGSSVEHNNMPPFVAFKWAVFAGA